MARRCPICGTENGTCGPTGIGNAVTLTTKEKIPVAKLDTYTFKNEDGREVSLRLSVEDAKKRGLTKTKAAEAPANKARGAQNKGK